MTDSNVNSQEELDDFDMNFSFDDEDIKIGGNGSGASPLFPVEAQVDNVELSKVAYGETDGGSKFVEFEFCRKDGGVTQTMNGREYQVLKDDDVYQLKGETKIQALTRKGKEFNTRLLEVAKAFGVDCTPSGTLRTSIKRGSDFKGFIEQFCQIVMAEKSGKAYMKVMRNGNGYPCHPKFNEFVQKMEEGVECSLSYTPREMEINESNAAPQGIQGDDDDDLTTGAITYDDDDDLLVGSSISDDNISADKDIITPTAPETPADPADVDLDSEWEV